MREVLWIGGSPCSGKSTVAAMVAARRGLPVLSCDDAFERHAGEDAPTLLRLVTTPMAERLAQPVDVQVADVRTGYGEQFPCLLADLASYHGTVVVEGAALLPELLAEVPVRSDHAVWLVPTEEFQREQYARRGWAADLVRDLADPAEAFDRWMRRDASFAAQVAIRAEQLGYRVVVVDGSIGVDELAAEVDAWLS
jgi:cytidylate kinase